MEDQARAPFPPLFLHSRPACLREHSSEIASPLRKDEKAEKEGTKESYQSYQSVLGEMTVIARAVQAPFGRQSTARNGARGKRGNRLLEHCRNTATGVTVQNDSENLEIVGKKITKLLRDSHHVAEAMQSVGPSRLSCSQGL